MSDVPCLVLVALDPSVTPNRRHLMPHPDDKVRVRTFIGERLERRLTEVTFADTVILPDTNGEDQYYTVREIEGRGYQSAKLDADPVAALERLPEPVMAAVGKNWNFDLVPQVNDDLDPKDAQALLSTCVKLDWSTMYGGATTAVFLVTENVQTTIKRVQATHGGTFRYQLYGDTGNVLWRDQAVLVLTDLRFSNDAAGEGNGLLYLHASYRRDWLPTDNPEAAE